MDAERAVVDHLNGSEVGAPAYYDVPASRPDAFVTVERTGGATGEGMTETPLMVARCWAPSRRSAAELGDAVRAALVRLPETVADVSGVSVTSAFRDVDLESGTPRYQLVFQMYANN